LCVAGGGVNGAVFMCVCVAGGGVSGAVFNPSLAFSTQFLCSGNTFLEYSVVYWAAPLLGNQANTTARLSFSFEVHTLTLLIG